MESEIMQINLTEMINVVVENVNAWLPTVTSVLSMIICLIWGVAKIKKASNDLKSDETIKNLESQMINEITESKEVRKLIKKYMDENHRIMRIDNEESGES